MDNSVSSLLLTYVDWIVSVVITFLSIGSSVVVKFINFFLLTDPIMPTTERSIKNS